MSLDFEGIGIMRGARRGNADRDAIIAQQNEEIRELRGVRDELRIKVARLERAFAFEQAHSAGLGAQTRTLRDALASKDPGNPLLVKTGRTYLKTGMSETQVSLVYSEAFDAKAKILGMPELISLRAQAK